MKIAAITDDGQRISAHFGRARHFLVFTVEDGEILSREMRDKAGHHDFTEEAGGEHETHEHHGHGERHEHQEDDEHHAHHGRHDPRGHGFGRGAGRRHARMIAAIEDCDVLLARGMGQGAYRALQEANITAITTEIKSVEGAVEAYLAGKIVDRPERRH